MSDSTQWPRDIWAAERGETDPTGFYVVSEFATIPRWEGDPERDREFHHYVDADVLESHLRHSEVMLEQARSKANMLEKAVSILVSEPTITVAEHAELDTELARLLKRIAGKYFT